MATRSRRHFFAWARRLTAVAVLLLIAAGLQPGFHLFRGSLAASELFGTVPLADPLSALEIVLSSRTLPSTLLLGAALVALIYALLGRIFCGWVCPLGLVTDLNDVLRRRIDRWLRRRGRSLPVITLPTSIKYWVLAGFLLASFLISLPVFTTFSPINWLVWGIVFGLPSALLAIAAWLLLELVSPRLFCRSLCPLGALYSLIGRFGLLRIRISSPTACRLQCAVCDACCPMGIHVMADHATSGHATITDPECTRCGACVDVCPAEVLSLAGTSSGIRGAAGVDRVSPGRVDRRPSAE